MKEPKTIMIDEQKYVRADSIQSLAEPVDGMRYCIARCHDAGVHAGFVKEQVGKEVVLLSTRRLWRWHGRTLSGLALEGTDDAEQCKFAPEIPEIKVLDACEVIPCTDKAIKSIRFEVKKWKND